MGLCSVDCECLLLGSSWLVCLLFFIERKNSRIPRHTGFVIITRGNRILLTCHITSEFTHHTCFCFVWLVETINATKNSGMRLKWEVMGSANILFIWVLKCWYETYIYYLLLQNLSHKHPFLQQAFTLPTTVL